MILEELKQLAEAYEKALIENRVEELDAFFWDSPEAVRLGPTENLFGSEAIREFRKNRPAVNLARKVTRIEYMVLDDNHGVINLTFEKMFRGQPRIGRQSQTWKRFSDLGWKIVSAHVSFMEPEA